MRVLINIAMQPPDLILTAAEAWRTVAELALAPFVLPALAQKSPQGDGHPVLVLPGFMATAWSTYPLRAFVAGLGYSVHEWGLGRNLGPLAIGHDGRRLEDRLSEIFDLTGRKVSLVGWSLGGVMAREVAKRKPGMVRQVVSMGSPFASGIEASHVWHVYKAVTGTKEGDLDPASIAMPPPVPSTAVYSKSDGIVHWKSCVEQDSDTTDSVEVVAAHCALGLNASALGIVAEKLAMPENGWRKLLRR